MLETVTIFEQMFGVMAAFDKQISDTIIWPDIKTRVQKYASFLDNDTNKMKKIVKKSFTS